MFYGVYEKCRMEIRENVRTDSPTLDSIQESSEMSSEMKFNETERRRRQVALSTFILQLRNGTISTYDRTFLGISKTLIKLLPP